MQDAPSDVSKQPSVLALSQKEKALLDDPARRFGRYVVLAEVGHGGMGVVYRAWDARLRRVVALKMAAQGRETGTARTVRDPLRASAGLPCVGNGLIDQLQREASVASRLSHPNLVRVHDAGICEGIFYFTMELLEGTAAAEVPLPMREREAARLIATLARAVAHAHRMEVLHRDIKPANILLTPRGEPVLIDFGLARDLTAPSNTMTGDVFGTPWYMAPEQAKGKPELVSTRTDIYGLGATLYHLVAGRPPYAELAPAQVVVAVASHPPYPASTINPCIGAETDRIVLKAMARDPGDRYATADALADDLERLMAGGSTARSAAPEEVIVGERVGPAPPSHLRNRRRAAWVLAAASSLLIGAGLAIIHSAYKPDEAPLRAATPPSEAEHPSVARVDAAPACLEPGPPPEATEGPPSTPTLPASPPSAASSGGGLTPPPAPPALDPPLKPPPTPPKADPPKKEAADAIPKEAREAQQAALDALHAALAMTFEEPAADWRARLKEALSLAEQASKKAPSWPAPRRLRADALFALSRYGEASVAYGDYAALQKPSVQPAEALVVEFLEWFRLSRPWAEELTPTAAKQGTSLADRLDAAASGPIEASPFLPWKPSSADVGTPIEVVRADLSTLASLARQDYARAADQAKKAAKPGGGIPVCLADLMAWLMVDWNARPDTLLISMRDGHVRTPEPWLVASCGLAEAGRTEAAEEAANHARDAREGDPLPEVCSAMGLVAWHQEDLDRAKDQWGRAQAAVPTSRVYLADLGAVCLVRGEMPDAVKHLVAALSSKTSPDAASDRLVSFVRYEIACADVRLLNETDPPPRTAERTRLAREAVASVRDCVQAAARLPRETETSSKEAPRLYAEWTMNNVRHWALVDPWLEGLKERPTDYRAMKDSLK